MGEMAAAQCNMELELEPKLDETPGTGQTGGEAACNRMLEENPMNENCLHSLQRELPEGKEFHLFFSYSSEDFQAVDHMILILEKEPYHLKCCFDKRDFNPGATILNNINHCIAVSVKTVFILTPDFVESHYCEYETTLAQQMSLAERKNIVIPFLLKPCNIPDALKVLNFVKVEEIDALDKLARMALMDPKIYQTPFQLWSPLNQRAPLTGFKAKASQNYFIDGQSYRHYIHPFNARDKEIIRNYGIQLTEEDMNNINQIVNSSALTTDTPFMIISLHLTAGLFLYFLLLLLYSCFTYFSDQGYHLIWNDIVKLLFFCISIPLSTALMVTFLMITYQKLEYRSCKLHVKELVDSARKRDGVSLGDNDAEAEFVEKESDRLLKTHVDRYAVNLWKGKLNTNDSRHTNTSDKCLCQYIEEAYKFNYKVTFIKRLFQRWKAVKCCFEKTKKEDTTPLLDCDENEQHHVDVV